MFENDRAFFLGILRFDSNPPSVQAVQHVTSGPEGNEFVAFTLLSLPLYLVEDCLRLLDEVEPANSSATEPAA